MEPLIGAAAQASADVIKETSDAGFMADVIDASQQVPVIVDFWAPWCGPCKQLGPALEKAVTAARGKVRLVKLNVDQSPAVATQMRIQSIPAVYAFFQGRPIDGFVGALPESQVKAFVDKLAKAAGSPGDVIDDALADAQVALEAGDPNSAKAIYGEILRHAPETPAAVAGMARAHIALGDVKAARKLLDGLTSEMAKAQEIAAVRTLLDLNEQAASGGELSALRAKVEADPDDHQSRIDLALALYAAGDRQGAADALIESIRRDRDWNEQAARKQLLKLFEAFGPTDPVTIAARRRLSSLLFS